MSLKLHSVIPLAWCWGVPDRSSTHPPNSGRRALQSFPREEGIFEDTQANAVMEVVASQLAEAMREKNIQGADGHAAQDECGWSGYFIVDNHAALQFESADLQPVCVTTSYKNFCMPHRMDGVCLFGMNKHRQFQFV